MSFKPWTATHWPEGVPHDVSGWDKPLPEIIDRAAASHPQATYTIMSGGKRNFAQVKKAADKIASFLAGRGIVKGDRVAIFLPNIPQYPEIYFGILKAGAVCVTCNPMYKADELNYQLNDSGAKAVFGMDHPEFYETTRQAVANTQVDTVVVCSVKPYLPLATRLIGGLLGKIPAAKEVADEHFRYENILQSQPAAPPEVEIDPNNDLALIIYTGGTTGLPKGAALTHSNIYFDLVSSTAWIRVPHEPGGAPEGLREGGFHTFLGVLPWYHSFGMTMVMLMAAHTTSRLVCIPDPRAGNPPFTDVLKAVQKYKVTTLTAVPTIYVAFTNHPLLDKFDLSSVIACGSGGAPMPVEAAKRFEEATGAVIFEGYGLSETSPNVTVNPTNTKDRKFGSVGFPIPGTMVKIVDTEMGTTELPRGEDGEIAICGPQVMQGYWNKPEENKAVFRVIDGDRYFLSGDIGHVDEDGYIIITDRKKDLILVGGFNVYPREVEEVFFTHPKVEMAAVIGVPDAHSGEAVKVFIQLKAGQEATEQEFIDWAKTKMAGYKRPKFVEFRSEMPTSVVGKVLRRVLRDEELKK